MASAAADVDKVPGQDDVVTILQRGAIRHQLVVHIDQAR